MVEASHDGVLAVVRDSAFQRILLQESPADAAFDRLTRLTTRLLHVPVALVFLVDQERQFLKSAVGLSERLALPCETPLSPAFCQHVVASQQPLIVADARLDPLLGETLAIPELNVVAIAEIPLITAAGATIGAFCAIDVVPRQWSADDVAVLRELAAAAMAEVEAHLRALEAERERRDQTTILESITDAFFALDHDWRFTYLNAEAERVLQRPRGTLLGRCLWEEFPAAVNSPFEQAYRRAVADQARVAFEAFYPPLNLWVDVRANPTRNGLSVYFHDITARKRTEDALRASEERYRTLFESMDEGLCILQMIFDAEQRPIDYRFVEINPVFEQQTGMQDALGRTARELVPGLEPFWFDMYGQVALTGEPVRFVNHAAPMGRWFDVYAFRIGAPHEHKVALLFNDITARKQAEEALRESEARFRLMVDAVPESIWITDADGRTEFLNKQWCDYCGVPFEPSTAAEIAIAFLHPEDAPRLMAAFAEAMRTGKPWEIEQRNRSAAGEYRWFLNRASPYRDPHSGQITKWVGVGLDIHDRKQAEEAVRESEARFRAVADLVPDLLWSSDPRGALDWFNQRWFDYTGQTLDEAYGFGWLDAVHPDDREPALQALQSALNQGVPLRHERRLRGVDGNHRWFLVEASPLRDMEGQIVRWYGSATDVHSERLAFETAQAALRVRDEFVSMISHDLKQPLGVINAYAELAQRRLGRAEAAPDARLMDSLGKIEGAASRMTRSINDLLDVTRLEAGQPLDLELKPTDLLALVRHVVAEQQQITQRHQLRVMAKIADLVGDYDEAQLERVLANLLSNAIKYSPEGGPISISVSEEDDDQGGWAVIAVQDAGLGIPAADLPLIFDRFRRAGNVVGQIGGSGIGLTSAQQVVQHHGGTIKVESIEGQGSTFTIRLPRASR